MPRGVVGPREQSRQAIIDATVEVLSEVGYARLAIETVAARARVGKATIYRWWPSKPDLVLAAFEEVGAFAPLPQTGDMVADVAAAIHTTRTISWDSPLSTVLPALALDVLADPELRNRFHDLLAPRREEIVAAIRRAAEAGHLPADIDAELLIDIYGGTLMYRALITGEGTDDYRMSQLTELLLRGRLPTVPPAEGGE
jgi:AcrR family transcriptional regulator